MTEDTWLVKHPYLQGIADLLTLVKATWDEIPVPSADARNGITTSGIFMRVYRYCGAQGSRSIFIMPRWFLHPWYRTWLRILCRAI